MTEHVADEPVDSTEDAAPMMVMPDRADAPVSEITERFLRAVVAQIPLERIEELHLFSPLRQSGVETGIAVVAARVPSPPPLVEPSPEPELALRELNTGDVVVDDTQAVEADAQAIDMVADIDDAVLVDDDVDTSVDVTDVGVVDAELADAELADAELADAELADAEISNAPIADAEIETVEDIEDLETGHASLHVTDDVADSVIVNTSLDDSPYRDDDAIPDAVITPIERHTVYTARYRLVQKGPERGKWEADVVAEADAPLITVEMVVRGVQRRAGEESEILRYTASQIARALRLEWPLPSASASDTQASAA